jgi:hypothetical protein
MNLGSPSEIRIYGSHRPCLGLCLVSSGLNMRGPSSSWSEMNFELVSLCHARGTFPVVARCAICVNSVLVSVHGEATIA